MVFQNISDADKELIQGLKKEFPNTPDYLLFLALNFAKTDPHGKMLEEGKPKTGKERRAEARKKVLEPRLKQWTDEEKTAFELTALRVADPEPVPYAEGMTPVEELKCYVECKDGGDQASASAAIVCEQD